MPVQCTTGTRVAVPRYSKKILILAVQGVARVVSARIEPRDDVLGRVAEPMPLAGCIHPHLSIS